jgi:hypothetical protein
MLKKNFVSISFSPRLLQVLQLNSSKKKVVTKASLELPEGLIMDHEVADRKSLAEAIRNLWQKLKIKEKSVGVVVPEFSTFIKNLELPKIGLDELDEAVVWQAQEFLPKAASKMSMDWKIVGDSSDNYQVLVVAVEKKVLSSYVETVALAGLLPFVVETPALSLVRLTEADPAGKIIIYSHFDETFLLVARGRQVLASSVVGSQDRANVVSTAVKIVNHYKEVKVEKIVVAGVGDANFAKNLESSLKRPVSGLDLRVAGFSDGELQKYLIPLALQLETAADPSDENTINLLPRTLVKKYDRKRLELKVWSLLMVVTFLVWSSFFATLGADIFTRQQINSFKSKNTQSSIGVRETKGAREQIKRINEAANRVIKIDSVSIFPQQILNGIYKAKPDGIFLSNYKVDLDLGTVQLRGSAANRADLLLFKQNLEKDNDFVQVSVPISSFEIETDLNFNLSCIYAPSVNVRRVKK